MMEPTTTKRRSVLVWTAILVGLALVGSVGAWVIWASAAPVRPAEPATPLPATAAHEYARIRVALRRSLEAVDKAIGMDQPLADAAPSASKATAAGEDLPEWMGAPGSSAGEMNRLVREIGKPLVEAFRSYARKRQEIGRFTLLDPRRLEKEGAIEETRAIVAKARAALEEHRDAMCAVMEHARERVAQSRFPPEVAAEVLIAFGAESPYGDPPLLEELEHERSMLQAVSDAAEYLGTHRDVWVYEPDTITFDTDELRLEYLELVTRIRVLRQEGDRLESWRFSGRQEAIRRIGTPGAQTGDDGGARTDP